MKNTKQLSSVASAAAVLALLVCVSTSLAVWRSPVEGASQDSNKRMIHREHAFAGEPVTFTKITVGGKEIEFKKEFDAGDDWFKSLAVTVENRSQKPVIYIEVRLLFPLPEGSTDRVFFDYMRYGSDGLEGRKGGPSIAPGESVEIRMTADHQSALGDYFRGEAKYSRVDLVELSIGTVLWADGTEWYRGRSKDASGKWSVTKPTWL